MHPDASSPQLVLVVMCVGYFLVLLDVTGVNVALPQIGSGLEASVSGLQWVVDGYAITLASLMLGAGTIGDIGGHKRVVLWGLAVFGVASMGCGLAPSTAVLVGFRVLQGVGAALLLPGTLAVIANAFPEPDERAKAIGLWAGIGSAAPAGPLLGGALVQAIDWRAVFFINVPVVIVAFAAAARVVSESTESQQRRLDVPDVLLGAALLAAITFAFVEAGQAGVGVAVLVAIILAVGALVAFVIVEAKTRDPMLPLALFRRADFSTSNAVAATMNLAALGLIFVLTLYLQRVQGRSALAAGVAALPLFVPLGILSPLAGRLTARTKRPMAIGLLSAAIGVSLLVVAQPDSSYLTLLPALLLWGIGLGILTPAVVAAAIGAVPADRAGLASAVNNTARQAGGAIGIAAFGALAGQPGSSGFITGLHTAALIAAGMLVAATIATLALIPAPRGA